MIPIMVCIMLLCYATLQGMQQSDNKELIKKKIANIIASLEKMKEEIKKSSLEINTNSAKRQASKQHLQALNDSQENK